MKYIKYFENFGRFEIDNELYKQISDEYYIILNKYDDEWWLIETYLPHNKYLIGGDYAHYIAETWG